VKPGNSDKPHLIAVDDNADSAELIARIATKCGYEAKAVTQTRDLDRILADWKPHVLTLDLCLEEEDGIGLLGVIQDSGFAGALIIISGQDDWLRKSAGRLACARGLNVTHDLPKPVDLKRLRDILVALNTPAKRAPQKV